MILNHQYKTQNNAQIDNTTSQNSQRGQNSAHSQGHATSHAPKTSKWARRVLFLSDLSIFWPRRGYLLPNMVSNVINVLFGAHVVFRVSF